MSAGNLDAARQVLHELLQHEPEHSAAHMTLGHIAWACGRVRESAQYVLKVAAKPPLEASAIIATARALLRVGETVAARGCLEHPALASCQDGHVLMLHAALCRQLGEDEKALGLLNRAFSLGVDGTEFRFVRGLELLICGKLAEAEADLEMSLRMDPSAGAAALELARIRKRTPDSNHLVDFKDRLNRVSMGSQDHAALEFARYKELEDVGRYEEAWQALVRANSVMKALHPWDTRAARQRRDELIRICTPEFVSPDSVNFDEPQPIFILGMPRSGTTLLDRLLGSHPDVVSTGELEDFAQQLCWAADQPGLLDTRMLRCISDMDYAELGRRYLSQTRWRARGARFFIDKQPWNHAVAGLIARALPSARLLHISRNPMDVCFSNFRAMLGARYAYSFDLEALGLHYLDYCRLQAHWQQIMPRRLLNLSYHDLVHDTEGTLRKVLAFCGLGWDPACSGGAGGEGAIGTLSAVQAREPIHHRAFRQWRPYKSHLSGLTALLASAEPQVVAASELSI